MIAQISDIVVNFFNSILDVYYDLKYAKQRRLSNKVEVTFLHDGLRKETRNGLLTKNRRLCIIPDMEFPIVDPVVYTDGRKQYIYQPGGLHEGIKHETLKGLSECQTHKALVRWKYMRQWVTTEIVSKGTIDFTLFNNNISPDFCDAVSKLINSYALDKLLSELRTGEKIMYVLIGMGFGGTLFGFGLLIFHIILAYFT